MEELTAIRLPLRCAWGARRYGRKNLVTIEMDLTEEDHEYYERVGWKEYRPEHHRRTLLPSLGDPRYFRRAGAVVEIHGKRYALSIEDDGVHDPGEPEGKHLVLTETSDPETVQDGTKDRHYWKVFGQPRWIQNEVFPADSDGDACFHLITEENGWADMGNWNIMVGRFRNGAPTEAYFEASCC